MAVRKTMKKKAAMKKKKTAGKSTTSKKNLDPNAKIHMNAYKNLEREIHKTWEKLRKDVKKRNKNAILKGRDSLMLLLGECNYMSRECMRTLKKFKRR